jgi:hypothetical protein
MVLEAVIDSSSPFKPRWEELGSLHCRAFNFELPLYTGFYKGV